MKKIILIALLTLLTGCTQSNEAYVKKLQQRKTRDSIVNNIRIKDSLIIDAIIPYKKVGIYDHENNSGAWTVWDTMRRMSNANLVILRNGSRYRSNRKNWKVVRTNEGWDRRFYQQDGYYQYQLFFDKNKAKASLEKELAAQRIEYNTAVYLLHERRNN